MRLPGQNRSGEFSSGTLILTVSAFVAVFANLDFFRTAVDSFGSSAGGLLFVASLLVFITSIFVLVLSAVCHRALVKPVLILFLMLSSILAYFAVQYGTIFDHRMIANTLQTDAAEARDLFNPKLLLYVAVLGVAPSLAVWKARLSRPHWRTETLARLELAGGAAAVLVLVMLAFGGHYASMMRDHHELVDRVNPTFALYSAVKLAARSVASPPQEHIVIGTDARTPPADGHRELVIMVVGETVRADHWALNGYDRETTPLLRNEQVINFPDFWSCATSTAESVPCMFSNLGRAQFSPHRAMATDNALDILARAGVSVLWRDNNSSSKGVADRVTFEDFKSPAKNPICDGEECRDEGMLRGLQEYIDGQSGDVLIVLHQMGNHGPAYYKRYPKEFERFTPVCKTNDLGACTQEEIRNAYDNAILYTDDFLSKVIGLLKRNDANFETAMVYVSDHGESLGEYGLYLHAAPYMLAPEAQKHVPAVLWLGARIRHEIRLETIESRRNMRWSHDNVFSTLLGLFEIRSDVYDSRMDLLEHLPELSAVN